MIWLLVAAAGALGSVTRFEVDAMVARHHRLSLPVGTAVVNVSACLLLGLVTGWVLAHTGQSTVKLIVGTGFLGGYSTFSTASVEGARLLRARRPSAAVVHAAGMLALSMGAAAVGLALTS